MTIRADADQSHMPRPLPWSDDDIYTLARKHLVFRVLTRGRTSRLQRLSDHLRGFTFGAAAVLALVAAYVFAGAPT